MRLTVTAGKGGVGKTTVAYNLAAELDAVAVDADLGMADLPSARGPDLHDVLAGRASAVEAVREGGPVAVLPCGRSLAGARAADPAALVDAVRAVEREYGRVVVDAPAGMHSDAGVALLAGQAAVVVTRPSRAALAGALRTRELARAVGTSLARVVLNRAGRDSHDRLASALGAPVTAVPESECLAEAHRAGQPVRAVAPGSTASERFTALASAVETVLRESSSGSLPRSGP
jgi:septum site-determining protein MinD